MPPRRSQPIDRYFQTPQRCRDTIALWSCTIFPLHWDMAFSGHFTAARTLLELFLPLFPPPEADKYPRRTAMNARILATLWAYAPGVKPWVSLPWSEADIEGPYLMASHYPYRDIFHAGFYGNWEEKYWIPSKGVDVDPDTYDPHSWPRSDDHYEIAACARMLCRVPLGQIPQREAMEEAFEAMKTIWGLPLREYGINDGTVAASSNLPRDFDEVMPTTVFLSFCVGLGKKEEAVEVFRDCAKGCDMMWPYQNWAEMYLYCAGEGRFLDLISKEEADECVDVFKRGLEGDKVGGNRGPDTLAGLMETPWVELLRRFSEAAFKTHRKKYRHLENAPQRAGDILLPPITPELLAEVENRLGPLPEDMREMVLIANGFRGLWRTFGGGFPGIDKFEVTPCDEQWLFFRGDDLRTDPKKETRLAPIWMAWGGAEEGDDWEHIICPTETWRKLVGDDHPSAGEYRVT